MEFKRNFNKKVKTEPENLSEVMYNINNNMHAITKKHDEDVNDFVSTDIGSFKHNDSSDESSLVKRAFGYFHSNKPSETKEDIVQTDSEHKKEEVISETNISSQSKISPKSDEYSQYESAKKYHSYNFNANTIEKTSPHKIKKKTNVNSNVINRQNYEYPLMSKNIVNHNKMNAISISDVSKKSQSKIGICNLEEIYSVGSYNIKNKLSASKTESDNKILAQIEKDLETVNSFSENLHNQSPFEKSNQITIDYRFPKNPNSKSCNKNDYQYTKNNNPQQNFSKKTKNIIKKSENNKNDILFIENLSVCENHKENEQISLKDSLAKVEIKSFESSSVQAMKILNGFKHFMMPSLLEVLLKKFEDLDLLLSLQKSKITQPLFSDLKKIYESSNNKT